MKIVYFVGSLVASALFLVGVGSAIEKFYPRGDGNSDRGGQIMVTATPIVRPSRIREATEKLAVVQQAAAREMEKPDASLGVLLARADPEAGQETAKLCAICHTWTKGGGTRVGPNLYGVVGRDIARDPGFSYSPALQQKGGRWSFNEIYEWIGDPGEVAPGNNMAKMGFAGLRDAQQRANVIAFLAKQSDNPIPLPTSRW
jgi:cytochrome c